MKFCCIVATRGRPRQALGVIEAIRLMASGEHEVQFILACDDDDPADTAGFFRSDSSIMVECGPRPTGVASCWNRCVSLTDADIILTLPDDCLICTPIWDQIAAHICANHKWVHPDLRIGALNDLANPGQATLFIFHRRWYELCGLFDERFPFWFSDSAISETYSFITGQMLPVFPINVANKPGVFNPRLRDMPLWWKFYAATRAERRALAAEVRQQLNLPEPPNMADVMKGWEERDRVGLPESEKIVQAITNPTPPDDHYRLAKANAECYLSGKDNA